MTARLPYPPPWMPKNVLAAHLGVSTSTVDNWAATGVLPPGRKRGGMWMWKWSEVNDRMTEGQPGGSPDATADRIRNGTRAAAAAIRSH